MKVAKVLLFVILALPFLELAAFIAVGTAIGFGWALILQLAASLLGLFLLRHAGGSHVTRVRAALAEGTFSSLSADSAGGLLLFAGILLIIPGFITDAIGLTLLPLAILGLGHRPSGGPPDGVVDLEPEQWHQVPDPALDDRRNRDRDG